MTHVDVPNRQQLTYRLFQGQPSVCLNALICSSTFLVWERLTELCAISACEHLLCIIKIILTKYDWYSGKYNFNFLLYF